MLYQLLLTAGFAQIQTQLRSYCPRDSNGADTYVSWSEVDEGDANNEGDWYWGDDWEDFLRNSTAKDGTTGSFPPDGGIHPAGFKLYNLAIYSEPPVCFFVPQSRNKKVEILIESDLENANLCITDASANGVGTNDVGNVENCGSGKVYACFTAATASGSNFGFYVSCKYGCEDSDVDIWVRIRTSKLTWDTGKTDTANDLEHWCEAERGTNFLYDEDDDSKKYYTYPSDLVPDEPSEYPFHINQIFGFNSGGVTRPTWLLSLLAFVGCAYLLA